MAVGMEGEATLDLIEEHLKYSWRKGSCGDNIALLVKLF
jgi:hypothetical protein